MDTIDIKRIRQLKEQKKRPKDLLTPWASCRTTLVSHDVLVCQALKNKFESIIERMGYWQISKRLRDAVPYHTKYETTRKLKAKENWLLKLQRLNRYVDEQSGLIASTDPS